MTLCAAVAVLLTGCGSDPKAAVEGGKLAPTGSPSAAPSAGGSSSAPAKSGGATHQVTLEVGGTGTTAIMFSGIGSGFEQQTLPWSKSGTAELTAAEQKVGYLVNVVPGTITGAGGKLQQAPCKITIDGKTVAESDGVTTTRGCSYTIKQ